MSGSRHIPCIAGPVVHSLHVCMLFKARSAAVYGIDAHIIDVEVDFSGVPRKTTSPPSACPTPPSAKPRPRPLRHQKLRLRHSPTHITINLAPADLKKEGSGFDLPIAIGILGAYGALASPRPRDFLLVGELASTAACAPSRVCCPSPSQRAARHPEPRHPRRQRPRSRRRRRRQRLPRPHPPRSPRTAQLRRPRRHSYRATPRRSHAASR